MGRPASADVTPSERARRACRGHLKDLKRIHAAPPPDRPVQESDVVRPLPAPEFGSGCGSPAAAMAALV